MNKLLTLLIASTMTLSAATFNVATSSELRTALSDAATNGEDDTIILADGTYKTTDDGNGTFIYLSNEDNNLILKGSSAENVILSGDHIEQILNHQSTLDAPMTLENLSFVDGNNTIDNGGGVYTDYSIEVTDCNFSDNTTTGSGGGFYALSYETTVSRSKFYRNSANMVAGGFYSNGSVIVVNTVFIENIANGIDSSESGGGFYAGWAATVTDSVFKNNKSTTNSNNASSYSGGGFFSRASTTVDKSTFENNYGYAYGLYSSYKIGAGGFCTGEYHAQSSGETIVGKSIFKDNNASTAGGFFSRNMTTIKNSRFANNEKNGVYISSVSTISNSIFINNGENGIYSEYTTKVTNSILTNSGIFIVKGEDSVITNNIFLDNNVSDINANSSVIIKKLENNYLDISQVTVSNFEKNNIFDGVNLGFVDKANGDYNLTASSDLIDAGTIDVAGFTLPETDLNGNARIAGGSIDIGPYEFSTTRPTINSVTYTGTAQELQELTFITNSTASTGRNIDSVEFDYLNNGTFTTTNTYTYQTAGTYTVNVKVTDSDGEFSSTTKTVIIAELAFANMTDEQKLVKAIDPAYYNNIIAIIDAEKSASSASGVTMGENNVVLDPNSHGLHTQFEIDTAISDTNTSAYEAGKQYVQTNPSEFSLVTTAAYNTALADMNATATSAGQSMVVASPTSYGLVAQSDLNASVSEAITKGVADGKQYVQDNLSEFSLVTQADRDTAVATATASGRNMVLLSPSAYGLVATSDVNSSVTEALASGITQGKEYVKNNLSEFGLVSKSDVKLTAPTISGLSTGWTLVSTPFAITDLSVFDSATVVWVYNNSTSSWSAYSSDVTITQKITDNANVNLLTTIPAGSGIWVQK